MRYGIYGANYVYLVCRERLNYETLTAGTVFFIEFQGFARYWLLSWRLFRVH